MSKTVSLYEAAKRISISKFCKALREVEQL